MTDESSSRRLAVLVLGSHRSGTSATSGVLSKLGVAPARTLIPGDDANPRGYWESIPVNRFNEAVLASAGSHWADWRAFNRGWLDTPAAAPLRADAHALIASEFQGSSVFALKDPRICRLLDFWLPIFAAERIAVKVVSPFRSPLETAMSLRRRNGFSISTGLALWLRHVLDAERASRGLERAFLSWRAVLADWRGAFAEPSRRLGLGLPLDDAERGAEVDAFLSVTLWRERADAAVDAHPEMHAWATQIKQALERLASDPFDPQAVAAFDRIGDAFDDACRLFARLWSDQEVRALKSQARADELERGLAAVQAQRLKEIRDFNAQLATARARIAEMEARQAGAASPS